MMCSPIEQEENTLSANLPKIYVIFGILPPKKYVIN